MAIYLEPALFPAANFVSSTPYPKNAPFPLPSHRPAIPADVEAGYTLIRVSSYSNRYYRRNPRAEGAKIVPSGVVR